MIYTPSFCRGSHCRAVVGCQTAASPGQGGGGEGGRDGWRRERREGRMGGRWEGREGGRHREEEEQHKGREVRKAQNELHVLISDMYLYIYMYVCVCVKVGQWVSERSVGVYEWVSG